MNISIWTSFLTYQSLSSCEEQGIQRRTVTPTLVSYSFRSSLGREAGGDVGVILDSDWCASHSTELVRKEGGTEG